MLWFFLLGPNPRGVDSEVPEALQALLDGMQEPGQQELEDSYIELQSKLLEGDDIGD